MQMMKKTGRETEGQICDEKHTDRQMDVEKDILKERE